MNSNPGNDDDPYYHSFFIFQTRFDIPKYYQIDRPLGTGGFGVVLRAINLNSKQPVAVKKILKPFINVLETKRILREIRILKSLQHDNVIAIKDLINVCHRSQFEEIYLVSESMDSDLHQIISTDQELSEDHIQFFMYQLLCGVNYFHAANVFHRDLKPSNLLVNSDCQLKICDFGLARTTKFKENNLNIMTEYVATRWYRAPELLLSWNEYSTSVDMWSIGCILGELLLRKPLLPGESLLNQLNLILNLVGTPSDEDLKGIASDRAKSYIKSLTKSPGVAFDNLFPNSDPLIIDLLKKLLVFNPAKRITSRAALDHPFFESIRDPSFETVPKFKINLEFEEQDVTIEELKDCIYKEMLSLHPELPMNCIFPPPILPNSSLYTLDLDGSMIYIDYEKQQNTMLSIAQTLFSMPNVAQQRQEQEVLEFLEVEKDQMEEEKT